MISACEPPRLLRLAWQVGEEPWLLELTLEASGDLTTLTLVQSDLDSEAAQSVGPGWEYCLDRLVASESGGDVAAVDLDRDYYPAVAEHYGSVTDAG